ncbi:MAG: DUF5666 domain-containing protein [Pseudomonadales bacterium]
MKRQVINTIIFAAAPLLIAGCGGGGGGDSAAPVAANPPPVAGGTSDPTIVKTGPITGFGSVFVDGQRFETRSSSTSYRVDDNPSAEDQLEVGMIVRVRSSSKNSAGEWVADDIEFDEELKGPVDSVGASSFVALGQTVNVSGNTFLDSGVSLASLAAGDLVEVSGYRNQADEIDATYVELKSLANVDEYEVLGQVRDLDTSAMTFRVGGLTVDYSSAIIDDVAGGLTDGMLVEVEDENRAYTAGDLTLLATKVEGEFRGEFKDEDDNDEDGDGRDDDNGRRSGGDSDEYEVTAVITEVVDGDTFLLGSLEVQYGSGTEFEGGTAADLLAGTRVKVEGDLNDAGVLVAREIKFGVFGFKESRISGLVNEVNSGEQTLVVMGVTVDVSGAELEDDRDDVSPFSLDDISIGDFIDVEGSETDGDVVRANEVERDDADDDSELRGLLDAFDATAGTVTILGQVVTTSASTRYELDDDMAVSADEFFARLHAGQSIVDADWSGAQTDTASPARELSLED